MNLSISMFSIRFGVFSSCGWSVISCLSDPKLQFSLEPEPVAINCTAFNHNGNLLVTGAADGVIRLFGQYFMHSGSFVSNIIEHVL